ncbi:protein kri1 homolog [Nannochloropsis oceanica]
MGRKDKDKAKEVKNKQQIFNDDDDGESDEGDETGNDKLRVNKAYASHFEATKKKQELVQLGRYHRNGSINSSSRKRGGLSDSSSESEGEEDSDASSSDEEDEDGEALTPALEVQILQTINSIRAKDPKIYRQDVTWFAGQEEEEEEEEEGREEGNVKEDRRKTYKDVIREQVLAAAKAGRDEIDSSSDEDKEGGRKGGRDGGEPVSSRRMAYDAEQLKLRKAFLEAAVEVEEGEEEKEGGMKRMKRKKGRNELEGEEGEEGEEGGEEGLFEGSGLLTIRKRGAKESAIFDKQIQEEVEKMVRGAGQVGGRESQEEEKEREKDLFLRDFVLGKKWREEGEEEDEEASGRGRRGREGQQEEVGNVDAGEEGHYGPVREGGREGGVDGGVDDEEDAEEVEKMEMFESKYNFRFEQEGGTALVSYGRTVEGSARRKDDKRKKEREAYKKRKEEERKKKEEELRRLKNLKKEEIRARLRKVEEVSVWGGVLPRGGEGGMEAGRGGEEEEEEDDDGEGDEEGAGGELELEEEEEVEEEEEGGSGGWRRESALEEKMLEELYALDYEDMIGDLPCRFKYRKVEGNSYGLTAEEILAADDQELNRFVSLKKLSTYREEEYRPKSKQRHRFREALKKKRREEEEEKERRQRKAREAKEGGEKKGRRKKQDGKEGEKDGRGGEEVAVDAAVAKGVGGMKEDLGQQQKQEQQPQQLQQGESKKRKRKKKKEKGGGGRGGGGGGGVGGRGAVPEGAKKLPASRLAAYGLA